MTIQALDAWTGASGLWSTNQRALIIRRPLSSGPGTRSSPQISGFDKPRTSRSNISRSRRSGRQLPAAGIADALTGVQANSLMTERVTAGANRPSPLAIRTAAAISSGGESLSMIEPGPLRRHPPRACPPRHRRQRPAGPGPPTKGNHASWAPPAEYLIRAKRPQSRIAA